MWGEVVEGAGVGLAAGEEGERCCAVEDVGEGGEEGLGGVLGVGEERGEEDEEGGEEVGEGGDEVLGSAGGGDFEC